MQKLQSLKTETAYTGKTRTICE